MRRAILASLPVLVMGCGPAAPAPTPPKPAAVAPSVPAPPPPSPTPRFAAKPLPPPAFDDPDRAKKIASLAPQFDKQVDDFFAKNKPPGLAVAMVADGKMVYSRMLGVRDKGSKMPVTARTLFRIGSITKT